jgi:hypothetical protein
MNLVPFLTGISGRVPSLTNAHVDTSDPLLRASGSINAKGCNIMSHGILLCFVGPAMSAKPTQLPGQRRVQCSCDP